MPSTVENRQKPHIPNHEMVRIIGRGSYGEIWLARSLTGTWRAVKIVDRRTFESDKAFQREFEGMAKFEPISRDDSGFVDILHVGRDEAGGFFYYVMELADDHLGQGVIDSANYVPKTIKTELSRRARLLADECITIGLSLSKALGALHQQRLVHRDIKPANIIFVGGVPKIADIGLVAASGQESYVGTEGYVPPEGPGTPQADIYSLGKVLYEMAMGKDRMDFPAVNSDLADLPDKATLLRLNDVLLRACAGDTDARYATAEELHGDLISVRDGDVLASRARRRWPILAVGLLVALALGVGAYITMLRSVRGEARVESNPPGAMVVLGSRMKRSPATFEQLPVGRYSARVMMSGYEPTEVAFEVTASDPAPLASVQLKASIGAAEIRSQPPGAEFAVRQNDVVSGSGTTPAKIENLVTGTYELWSRLDGRELLQSLEIKRGETTVAEVEFASGIVSVASEPPGVAIEIDGKPMGQAPQELMLPEGTHEVIARYRSWPEQRVSVKTSRTAPVPVRFEFRPGSVKLTSAPGGASVWQDGREIGTTPMHFEDLEPATVNYELRLAGYKNIEVSGKVQAGEQTFLGARFVKRLGPRRGEAWDNSLGMKFIPVGEVLMCVWPTRVQDYDAFCTATGRARPVPGFAQDGTHPVVRVNWEDAAAFCEWLTARELAAEQIEPGQSYRLPTDLEWSAGDGLPDEGGNTPEERDGKLKDFPWGKQWPPPAGTGNFADSAGRRSGAGSIPGYHDGFPQTSPVGNFPANRIGLFDMSGNVWQWCRDSYKGGAAGARDWGVLRGGSWGTATASELRASYRNVVDRAERDVIYGFRCVLVPEPR